MRTLSLCCASTWLATLSMALALTACGGSSSSNMAAPGGAVTNNVTPAGGDEISATTDQPASGTTPAQPDKPASDVAPASEAIPASDPFVPPTPAPAEGFKVGTTTLDPDLPPEPTLPGSSQICQTLDAGLTSLPNGLLPDSADANNTAPDTARIQKALTDCKPTASTGLSTNRAVRLASGPNGENAFLSGALNLPSGVTLWIDKRITLYASRDPRQFDKTKGTPSCGMITASDNGCLALINASKVANAAVVGDGIIDGRGGSPLISSVPNDPNLRMRPDGTAMSWWDIGWLANKVLNQAQNNPRLIQISNSRNFTLYRVTLQNAPKFHVVPSGVDGFTAWGVKIYTPTAAYEAMTNYLGMNYSPDTAKNTDGIDPASSGPVSVSKEINNKPTGDASNILIAYTSIRTGDDNIAIKGGTGAVNGRTYNVTVAHSHFYTGHGMSIGSEMAGTDAGADNADVVAVNGALPSVSNVKVYDLVIDGADNGLRIKSDWSRSGLVSNISYSNVCIRMPDSSTDGAPQAAAEGERLPRRHAKLTRDHTKALGIRRPDHSYYRILTGMLIDDLDVMCLAFSRSKAHSEAKTPPRPPRCRLRARPVSSHAIRKSRSRRHCLRAPRDAFHARRACVPNAARDRASRRRCRAPCAPAAHADCRRARCRLRRARSRTRNRPARPPTGR
jgi:polygalacturonase